MKVVFFWDEKIQVVLCTLIECKIVSCLMKPKHLYLWAHSCVLEKKFRAEFHDAQSILLWCIKLFSPIVFHYYRLVWFCKCTHIYPLESSAVVFLIILAMLYQRNDVKIVLLNKLYSKVFLNVLKNNKWFHS